MSFSVILQIVKRAFLWILIISMQVFAHLVLKLVPHNHWFFITLASLACVLFIAISHFEHDELILDMRELCLYDVLIHIIGLALYLSKVDPSTFMYGLTGAASFLMFGRLVWVYGDKGSGHFAAWPVFGVLGWYAKRQRNAASTFFTPSEKQARAAYAFMVLCLVAGFVLPMLGFKLAIAHIGFLSFLATPFLAKRTLNDMRQQYGEYERANEARIIAEERADRERAIAEEKERSAQLLAIKNSELERAKNEAERAREEAVQARQDAERARDEAERAKANEETISRALRTSAHDLLQNIALIGFVGHQIVEASTLKQKQEALQTFYDVNRKVTQAIEQIMYYAKLTTGQAEPRLEALEMCRNLSGLCRQWVDPGFDNGVELITVYPRGDGVARYVACDPMLVNHVLQNLLVNAISHGGPGCDRVIFCVRARSDHYLVQIRDCGKGIEEGEGPDPHANFLAFAQRVYTHGAQRGDGHGLGINIVRQMCEIAQIPIGLRSRLGKGSTFSLRMPKASAELIAATEYEIAERFKIRESAKLLWRSHK